MVIALDSDKQNKKLTSTLNETQHIHWIKLAGVPFGQLRTEGIWTNNLKMQVNQFGSVIRIYPPGI